jgi:hypothetical protein
MSTYALLQALARALDARASVLDDGTLPPELLAILNRCRDDLAVILAATEPDIAVLLDSAGPVACFPAPLNDPAYRLGAHGRLVGLPRRHPE